jgi:hypothetical protein
VDLGRCWGLEWFPTCQLLSHRAGLKDLHLQDGIPIHGLPHRPDRASSSPVDQPLVYISENVHTWAMISDTNRLVTCWTTFSYPISPTHISNLVIHTSTSLSKVQGPSSVVKVEARAAIGFKYLCRDVVAGTLGNLETFKACWHPTHWECPVITTCLTLKFCRAIAKTPFVESSWGEYVLSVSYHLALTRRVG